MISGARVIFGWAYFIPISLQYHGSLIIWYNAHLAWALSLNVFDQRSWGRYPSSHSHRIELGTTQPQDRGDGPLWQPFGLCG
jgi:hypothetical protein